MLARIIAALCRAIYGIATLPLQLIGWQQRPRAANIAAAALAEAEDSRPQNAAPTPVPEQPRLYGHPDHGYFYAPLGHLIRAHANRLSGDPDALRRPAPEALPVHVAAWLGELDDQQMRVVASGRLPPWKVQEHVLLGSATALQSLPPCVPKAAVRQPVQIGAGGRTGSRSGGGGPVSLTNLLEELGYAPAYGGPRPR